MTAIPEPVKRIVRQEAGFGCCKCGHPIIEYHHIVKGSQNPEDIMLLCPNDHQEATVGAMLEKEQRFYKSQPYNIQKGFVEGQLKVNQISPVVNIGNNQIIGTGDLLLVDGEILLSLEINEGRLELSMKLYDQQDRQIAEIKKNEWISGNPLPWDLESSFQWIRIRRKLRDIELEVDARVDPINVRANIWRNQHNFELSPKAILFDGARIHVGFENTCFVALRLEANTAEGTFTISPDRRFGSGAIISKFNKNERIRKGLEQWCELSSGHKFENIIDKRKYTVMKCSKCGKITKKWK
jgi:hypothetical protein